MAAAVRVELRVGLALTLVVAVPLREGLHVEVPVGLPLALAPGESDAVGEGVGVLVALGGHRARRTLGAPPSAMMTLLVAASHATPLGLVSVAPVPTPSATPAALPPTTVLTAPVATLTARIAEFPASATRTYAPSKARPAAVVEKDASAPAPSAPPCAPAPASVVTERVASAMTRSRPLPESMTYALPAPSAARPVGEAKHAPLPSPSRNADRPQPAAVATAPAALTARTAWPRLSTTR